MVIRLSVMNNIIREKFLFVFWFDLFYKLSAKFTIKFKIFRWMKRLHLLYRKMKFDGTALFTQETWETTMHLQ